MPKCKRCKRSIRDGDRAVEALGGKWCWKCFVCKVSSSIMGFLDGWAYVDVVVLDRQGCEQPFDDPAFFQRGNDPYCENCFSIILRNEI
jgi:hypothetical protein